MGRFFNKPKTPPLAREIKSGLLDLHSHVLFGLDDGARTIEESTTLLDGLAELGFSTVTATPHFDNRRAAPDTATQTSVIEALAEKRQGRAPRVLTGAECKLDDLFLALEAENRIPRIGAGDTYLVDLGFFPGSVPLGLEDIAFRLRIKGRALIVAHPERTPDLQRDANRADALRRAGMLFQLDVMSLVGKNGSTAKQAAYDMLDRGMMDIACTDIHRTEDLPILEKSLLLLWKLDKQLFERLFSTAPALVLAGDVDAVRADE